jgi:serpin B
MRTNRITAIIVVGILLIVSLSIGFMYLGDNKPPINNVKAYAIDACSTEDSVSELSDEMNTFAFKLYQQLAKESEGNVFFSPYSIFVALAMTYEGAKNETADEMQQLLSFPQQDDITLCSFGKIYNLLNHDNDYILHTANALWIKEEHPFLSSYLQYIEDYYMGKTTEVDFSNSQQAADLINQWIMQQTNNKIKDLIQSTDINPLTALILTNAIYFKGNWKYAFDSDLTTNRSFWISSNKSIQVPMMNQGDTDLTFNYTETEDMQIIKMPYKGDELSMIVYLPKDHNVSNVEDNLTSSHFKTWNALLSPQTVNIVFPKFTLNPEYSLKEPLMNLGMVNPFTNDADFSGMTGKHDLFIEKVKHKAFISIDEQGTEAAAATSVHMTLKAVQSTLFKADHPFVYCIVHEETNTILFMGRVSNPES